VIKGSAMTPKVSVIIPTCNRAQFLRAAVESVLNQTFQDFEIIVVDDASSDETPQAARSFADGRVRYLRQEPKKGQGAARNAGIRAARGEYIALLDDDDEWLPTKLRKQVALLRALPDEVGLIYTGYYRIDAASKRVLAEVMPTERGKVYDALGRGNWIGTCSTVLLRRRCLNKAGLFDEDLASGADYDMWLRVAREFEVDFIDEPLVRYSVHDRRISTNYDSLAQGLEAQLRKHHAVLARHKKTCSERYLWLGVIYCYQGRVAQGRRAFFQAIRMFPLEPRNYFNLCLSWLGASNFKKIKDFKENHLRRSRWLEGARQGPQSGL
jgi:glycosyltransferase involved in cell wall biosynthesis